MRAQEQHRTHSQDMDANKFQLEQLEQLPLRLIHSNITHSKMWTDVRYRGDGDLPSSIRGLLKNRFL